MNALSDLSFKDKYLGRPELKVLHQETKEWLSDIAFWNDEAEFLKLLINKNFIHLLAKEGLSIVANISGEISGIKGSRLKKLKELVELHEMRLSELIKSPYAQEEETYRKWHRHLENKIREMTLSIRALKEQLFRAVEGVLKEDLIKELTQ